MEGDGQATVESLVRRFVEDTWLPNDENEAFLEILALMRTRMNIGSLIAMQQSTHARTVEQCQRKAC
jgi:hypothetical protein